MEPIERWDYAGEGLDERDLPAAPLPLIEAWLHQAHQRQQEKGDVPEPDAISVATVDGDGQPRVRTVLMRYLTAAGPGFYTNLDSRKGHDLAGNARVAGTLTWTSMFRAVRFAGVARELDRDTVRDYFESRPWGSRIGAWASQQSQPIGSRADLERQVAQFEAKWPDTGRPDDVPLPDRWGGYVIDCTEVEFWAGRSSRLHDRLVFVRQSEGDLATPGAWRVERRQP
ncbi:pyridoxamine 5'-phosphate oxidase [Calidifontibacter terrae]